MRMRLEGWAAIRSPVLRDARKSALLRTRPCYSAAWTCGFFFAQ